MTLTTPTRQVELPAILLVEDNEDHLDLARTALEDGGLKNPIHSVGSVQEARAYLRESAGRALPCLILLDIWLPDVSGIELLREIKQDPALRAIPVVILTTTDERLIINAAYRLGADSHLIKPLQFEELYATVQQIGGSREILDHPHDRQAERSPS